MQTSRLCPRHTCGEVASMPSRADQFRAKAEECRALAAKAKDRDVQKQLLTSAEQYDQLAEHRDRDAQNLPRR
jgi:hypothetical protein